MGGFKPSRADIAGSTIVGSATTDVHEFTGSVNITGSLTINGAGVAPGGAPGGATTQIQYNNSGAFAGSANLTFDGSNLRTTGSLYISSSAEGSGVPLLRLDHAGALDDNPILFVTGSGFVGIGVLEPTYVLQVAASFTDAEPGGTNRAFKVEADNGSEWFSINGGSISFNAAGGVAKAGGIDLGKRFNIVDVFGTKGALGIGQYPGSPHNVIEVNSANSDQGGDWFVVDQSGSVGIGVLAPTQKLDVAGTANATVLSISGTAITSTAPELNLLDASATTPAVNAFAAVPRIAKATYDFSVLGGSAETKTLPSVTLPDNAIIVGGWIDTEDNLGSSGAASASFGATLGGSTTLFLGATGFNQFASEAGGPMIPVSQATSPATYLKLGAATTLTMTISTAALTSGIVHLYVQYVMGS